MTSLHCRECLAPITTGSKSGLCKPCAMRRTWKGSMRASQYHQGKTCKKCGRPITNHNQSGFCASCEPNKYHDAQRRKSGKTCRNCGFPLFAGNKTGLCAFCLKISPHPRKKRRYIVNDSHYRPPIRRSTRSGLKPIRCRYPACNRMFRPANPYVRYCSEMCRELHVNSEPGWAYRNAGRICLGRKAR